MNITTASRNTQQRQNASILAYGQFKPEYKNWPLNPTWDASQQTYQRLCGDNCNLFRNETTLVGSSWTNITAMECLHRYHTSFGNESDVILVVTYDQLTSRQIGNGESLLHVGYSDGLVGVDRSRWVRGTSNQFHPNQLYKISSNHSTFENWNVFGYQVDYCMSRQWDNSGVCALGFSAPMLLGKSQIRK